MTLIKKHIFSLPLSLVLFLFVTGNVYAEQTKSIIYDLNENGTTRITYDIILENSDSNSYITKYTLTTGLNDARNAEAKLENGQTLTTRTRVEGNSSNIEVSFPQPKIFQREVKWSLSFTTSKIIDQVGMIKEVAIPGFIGDFNLNLIIRVPESFGALNYYSLTPDKISNSNGKTIYTFESEDIREGGVYLAFGDEQVYDFTYRYELRNDEKNTNIRATIALPPDYKNQKIYFDKISPTPENGYKDIDGNYIAEYIVKPGENYEVLIKGKAVLKNVLGETFNASKQYLNSYRKEDKFWESNSTEIKNLALEITKNKTTDKEKGRAIYDYVVNTLKYNKEALNVQNRGRIGALGVLNNTNDAICQEYTDLFVALSRSIGIPSRMLAGYTSAEIGYDLPNNALHAWAEFYTEEEGWITVDPTWESTSGGYNFFGNVGLSHFVLAIRGDSSQNPPLVLSFISADDVSDNLVIKPVSESIEKMNNVTIGSEFPYPIKTVINNKGIIKIINETNVVLSGIDIYSTNGDLRIYIPEIDTNKAIFPGETEYFEVIIKSNNIFASKENVIDFEIAGVMNENDILSTNHEVLTSIETHEFLYVGIIALLIFLSILIIILIRKRQKTIEKKEKDKVWKKLHKKFE